MLGLTVVLAIVAAVGVGRMFDSRQKYENSLAASYELEAANSSMYATGVIEQAALAQRGRGTGAARARARTAYMGVAGRTTDLAAFDPPSARLVRSAVGAEASVRRLVPSARRAGAAVRRRIAAALGVGPRVELALGRRQQAVRAAARAHARSQTRTAVLLAAGAGLLALIGALALVTSLTASIRRPLAELVEASRRLADGDLSQRVEPSGPAELRELHAAFNEMAEGLERSRMALENERRRLAVVIESIGDALVVCDARGIVISANPRAAELVPALPIGADSDVASSPLPPLARGLEGDVEVEVAGRTLSVTAGRLETAGEDDGDGVVWTLRDISERARLEAMKTDFVAAASHELRSPLTSIKGFAELLARSEALGPREREFVDVVLQSTDRLVDLVNDLLDVTRLEAGRMELHPESLDVSALVDQVAGRTRPVTAAKGQRLIVDLAADLPMVRADPLRLRQILTNLIVVSSATLRDDGRITITGDSERDALALSVADDGEGLGQDDLDAVFDRFVRRGDNRAGTGLSLWLVRSLAELQGWSVDAQSKPGEGTVFTVWIPAAA